VADAAGGPAARAPLDPRRWPALLLVGAVRAYQLVVSPWLAPTCRFYPSCSAYAVGALREHGAVRGAWLALRRLLRCHPWNPGGVDPVPPRSPSRPERARAGDHRTEDLRGRASVLADNVERAPISRASDTSRRDTGEWERTAGR
jgi:putative membrane protein insertion efficiency factor